MAISLFCYTSKEINEILAINQQIAEREILFIENRFLLYSPKIVSDIHLEITAEFDFYPKNIFLIALNDKDYSSNIRDIANLFFEAYGNDILILFENETKIEKGKW
ncbi:hypothetical protein LU290_04045 [Moraxella nasibovis]|uniref:hypothetical protein n=1 Tax=Moraxella nasibovis TaxID=2904120 RepID=UPI00240ECE21|nr:hypothetical protein [Moraxella nasibovis]WFF39399.1 hypothetical protein LU290_04045 [Moraxella nasibovis]